MKRWLIFLLVFFCILFLSGCPGLFKDFPFVKGVWIGELDFSGQLGNGGHTNSNVSVGVKEF